MSSIPSAKGIDSTLALLRNPYGFIPDTCRDLEGDLFETRILFQKTICMTGAAAAEVFYSEDGLVRAGSMPKRIQRTLLGEKGIQGLDGEAHSHRKRMFMSLMASERIEALENTTRDLLDRYARDWQAAEKVVLYDEVREILTRAACAWSGVPLGCHRSWRGRSLNHSPDHLRRAGGRTGVTSVQRRVPGDYRALGRRRC